MIAAKQLLLAAGRNPGGWIKKEARGPAPIGWAKRLWQSTLQCHKKWESWTGAQEGLTQLLGSGPQAVAVSVEIGRV